MSSLPDDADARALALRRLGALPVVAVAMVMGLALGKSFASDQRFLDWSRAAFAFSGTAFVWVHLKPPMKLVPAFGVTLMLLSMIVNAAMLESFSRSVLLLAIAAAVVAIVLTMVQQNRLARGAGVVCGLLLLLPQLPALF